MVLKLLFDLMFPYPSPPSWGEEVEYQYHYHYLLDGKAAMIDRALDGHQDGSGPWELSLPPANIFDYEYIYKISAVLENLQFSWGQYGYNDVYDLEDYTDPDNSDILEEPYGMGRHLHYRPALPQDDPYLYADFLKNNLFSKNKHIVMLALAPFMTPYTDVSSDNNIYVEFRESLERWAYFTSRPTDDHYAFVSINYADVNKPLTIELRHNEAHPYEAYAFIILFHHLITRDVKFAVKVTGDVTDDATVKVDGHTFRIEEWNYLVIPIDTFRHVVNKIAKVIDDRKLKKHVYDVYQNIIKGNRIFENDDVARFYKSKTYENVARKIKDLIEDAYSNNVSVYADVNEISIVEPGYVYLYARNVEIRTKARVFKLKINKHIKVGTGVYLAPSASGKAGKMIKIF